MEKSIEKMTAFYNEREGVRIIQLTRCFLDQLIEKFNSFNGDYSNKKRHFFYFEDYDFILEIINDLFLLKAFNSKKGDMLYEVRYNFMSCSFNKDKSTVYHGDYYANLTDIPAFSFLPDLIREFSRAFNYPIRIDEDVINDYLKGADRAWPSSYRIEELVNELLPDSSLLPEKTLEILIHIVEDTQRPRQFLSTIAETEHTHHTNRLLYDELPRLLSSFCELHEEIRKEKQPLLHQQLTHIYAYLMEKKDLEGISTFERNVSLIKENYQDS